MKRIYNIALFIMAAIISSGLSGCITNHLANGEGTHYEVNVSSFGDYPLEGKSYVIFPSDPAIKVSDPEFMQVASYLAKDLDMRGAYESESVKDADMYIALDYGISDESYNVTKSEPVLGNTTVNSVETVYYKNRAYSKVNYDYGVTGYKTKTVRVDNYKRAIDIYAYDNKSSEMPMLWKTLITSSGSNNDFHEVCPYMFYAAREIIGTDQKVTYNIYERDNYLYDLWKDDAFKYDNVTHIPSQTAVTADGKMSMWVVAVERGANETVVVFVHVGDGSSYSISPAISLIANGQRYQSSESEAYKLGTHISSEVGNRYFKLHFPVALQPGATFDIIEYKTDGSETGNSWRNIKVK